MLNGNENNHKNGNGNGKKIFPSFICRIFNISPFEWKRVAEVWSITLFFKIGSAIGWTVLTAAFVSRFGIAFLPLLFVVNAALIILSTFFFEQFITRMKREILMILMLLMGGIALILAAAVYDRAPLSFFALVIFAESIFLAQFNVFIPILVGDRFTPLESQRTFPFVESGETIGGMIGGTLIGFFATSIPVPWFLYGWITMLAATIFIFVIASSLRTNLPPLPFRAKPAAERKKTKDQITLVIAGIKRFEFLKGLVVIVLLQWVFMNILEFQYTKAIEQTVTRKHEPTIALVNPQFFKAAILSSPEGITNLPADASLERAMTPGEQMELTKKLGTWKGIFHGAALLVQILLASRFITSLGIIGAMMLHPVVMLMSLVGMFLKFGFISSVMTRLNFEITNVIHKNAYFASHYAFPKFLRDQAAEFLEGIVRPMGTIVGMLFIAGFQLVFAGRDLSLWIHLIMIAIMAAILLYTIRLQTKYTRITKDQLFSTNLPYPEKLNAIEILAQKGHEESGSIFALKLREDKNEPPLVRKKILAELGRLHDYQTLPEILEALSDDNPDVRLEAAHALMNFSDIGEKFYTQAFSRYRMVETLKHIFRQEKSAAVRSAIIRLFSLINQPDIVPFLLDILNDEKNELRADCIYTLGLFHDPNTAYYIAPFLPHENPRIRANAMVALWQFQQYRSQVEENINVMLASKDPLMLKSGIFAAGETGLCRKKKLSQFLHADDPEIRLETAFALTKCGEAQGFETLLDHFLAAPPAEFHTLQRFFHRLSSKANANFKQFLGNVVSMELSRLMKTHGDMALSEMDPHTLERLRRLYSLLDQHEELFTIESALAKLTPQKISYGIS